jgi:hypothetical protein
MPPSANDTEGLQSHLAGVLSKRTETGILGMPNTMTTTCLDGLTPSHTLPVVIP